MRSGALPCPPLRYDEEEQDVVFQLGADGSVDAERLKRQEEVRKRLAEGEWRGGGWGWLYSMGAAKGCIYRAITLWLADHGMYMWLLWSKELQASEWAAVVSTKGWQ
jgi:hypothetical protein